VRLTGWDVPEHVAGSENKLRVIAAVECCDASQHSPSVVALVVRDSVGLSQQVYQRRFRGARRRA